MNITLLLAEKWRVQKELSLKAGHNMKKYAQLVDSILSRLLIKYKKKKKLRI